MQQCLEQGVKWYNVVIPCTSTSPYQLQLSSNYGTKPSLAPEPDNVVFSLFHLQPGGEKGVHNLCSKTIYFLITHANSSQAALLSAIILTTMSPLPTRVFAGATIPDTPLITKALEYTRAHSTDFAFNHVQRSM
jgi:hypothetical protein